MGVNEDMEGPVVVYRLFHKEEISELERFLLAQTELKAQFPDYKSWLQKIIPQIIKSAQRDDGNNSWRLAFGLFAGIPTNTEINKKLIGTALINLTTSNSVELKSFFISPKHRRKLYSKKLFDIIYDHCAKHGIRKIETSISSSDMVTLSAFLKQGYRIINEEDIYLNNQPN